MKGVGNRADGPRRETENLRDAEDAHEQPREVRSVDLMVAEVKHRLDDPHATDEFREIDNERQDVEELGYEVLVVHLVALRPNERPARAASAPPVPLCLILVDPRLEAELPLVPYVSAYVGVVAVPPSRIHVAIVNVFVIRIVFTRSASYVPKV